MLLAFLSLAQSSARAQDAIGYHTVRTDDQGLLLPWYDADPAVSYDFSLRQVLKFWQNVQRCNGAPYYMVSRTWDAGSLDSGIGGGQFAMALASWNLLYDYLGDTSVLVNMRYIADTYLANSLSDSADLWPNLPYPCNLTQQAVYDGDLIYGAGVTQPDKAGAFGSELVTLYKKTGEVRYLNAAVRIANSLADKIVPGDAENSPLPYRVNTHTGEIIASYTSDWTGTIRLFESLIKLGQGHLDAYLSGQTMLMNWILNYPVKNNLWGPYFEDVDGWSDTEINAVTIARFLIEHPEFDSSWRTDARNILDWTFGTFADSNWSQYGVIAIYEQSAYLLPGQSHTSRYAAAELLYHLRTSDTSSIQPFIRQLNWATYAVDWDGANCYPFDKIWFTDGYGDYVRHYLRAMASYPQLAPSDSDHILSSTSVLHNVLYSAQGISYEVFDSTSTEEIRMTAKPTQVLSRNEALEEQFPQTVGEPLTAPAWIWRPLAIGGVVELHHSRGNEITIVKQTAAVKPFLSATPVRIYPNPATSSVTISTGTSVPAKLDVFDALGRTLLSTTVVRSFHWLTSRNEGSPLPNGTYFVRISSGHTSEMRKLTISR